MAWISPESRNKKAKGFFEGTPAEYEQVASLTPEQLEIEKERRGAAKGAFGQPETIIGEIFSAIILKHFQHLQHRRRDSLTNGLFLIWRSNLQAWVQVDFLQAVLEMRPLALELI